MNQIWSLLTGVVLVGFFIASASLSSAQGEQDGLENGKPTASLSTVALKKVDNANHFNAIVREAGSMPLIFEFYADWCRPCRILEPVLMELDREFENRFIIYRVDVDAVPDLAETMGVRKVPEVVIFHKGEKVHSIKGLQPKDTYRRAMNGISGPNGGRVLPDETTVEK